VLARDQSQAINSQQSFPKQEGSNLTESTRVGAVRVGDHIAKGKLEIVSPEEAAATSLAQQQESGLGEVKAPHSQS